MKNMPLLLGTIVITLLMIVGIAFMFSGGAATSVNDVAPVAEAVLVPDNPNEKGATESAQVTVVEFSDFQCPACRATAPLVSQLVATYGDTVRFIYRHYPLVSIHRNAQAAAVFAQAAAQQGKFWEIHDILFEKQSEWSDITNSDQLQEKFLSYAQSLELDIPMLIESMNDSSVLEAVQRDVADGNTANLTGTPTFFVNGIQTPAPQLLSAVELLVVNTPEQDVIEAGE